MSLPRREVERQLTQKLLMEPRPGDHRYYYLFINGRKVARTHVSTGTNSRTLGDNMVSTMARQLNVTTSFFREIVNCTKTRDQYLQQLRDQDLLE